MNLKARRNSLETYLPLNDHSSGSRVKGLLREIRKESARGHAVEAFALVPLSSTDLQLRLQQLNAA